MQIGWYFIPSAVLLGALHGLEPGHSKTMMAAFIVAIRGTVAQAALLAVSATVSHTAIVWALALLALSYGEAWSAEASEPYLQLASGVLIFLVAAWVAWRTYAGQRVQPSTGHGHGHHHSHGHHDHHHHGGEHDHGHDDSGAPADEHERAHADALRRRLDGRRVTTGQVIVFGLTGGLIPCPAAITVLLLCLQVRDFVLGISLVLAFSIGLALTLLASGALAAWGAHHAARRWPWLGVIARRLPYLSSAVIALIGLYVAVQGWLALA